MITGVIKLVMIVKFKIALNLLWNKINTKPKVREMNSLKTLKYYVKSLIRYKPGVTKKKMIWQQEVKTLKMLKMMKVDNQI